MKKEYILNIVIVFILSIIFFLSCPLSSMAYEKEIKNLSASMTNHITQAGMKTIAVVDFTDLQGSVTELGRFLAEEFSVALAGAGKGFEIVDRTHLRSIIKEHKLSSTGIIDPQTARKLGKIAGVQALIAGTITPFGDSIRLSVKVLDTETAKVISATTGNIAKTKAIEELLGREIEMTAAAGGRPKVITSAMLSKGGAVKAEGFIFQPVKCRRSGGKVICTISLINNEENERELKIRTGGDKSCFYDNFGNQYPVEVKIGRRTTGDHWHQIEQKFPPKLPINVNLIAQQIRSNATYVTAAIVIRGFKKLVIVRNIPISN